MKDIKVVFMGTPSFAVPILENLIKETNVILLVSQPDREKDRKGNIIPTPTKKIALENNIEVFQPTKIKESYEKIISLNPDIIITGAQSNIVPLSAFFEKIFLCGPFFKVVIESVTILLLFYILLFWPPGKWDLSSPTRD